MAKRRLALVLASWFFCGYFPGAPGTAGSVCAWALAGLLVHVYGVPTWMVSLAAAALAPLAVWATETASSVSESNDPPWVVIDEVVGQWIALAPASRGSWVEWVAALALFRAFDIGKPLGIRRLESFPGGWGVVADDVAAGACAMIGVLLIRWIGT